MNLLQSIKNLVSKKPLPSGVMMPYAQGVYENITPDTAMKVSAFHRGAIYLSTQIAKLPIEIKNKKNEIVENKVSDIFTTMVNPEMNTFQFRIYMTLQAVIFGNAYAEIERDLLGNPIALWPIHSTDVILERTPDNQLLYRVANASLLIRGADAYLQPKDMFHVRNFHTKDGYLGQGIVAYAQETLGISLGADRFAKSIFSNGGMPAGVLKVTGTLSDEAYKRLKEDWAKTHGGRKTGGVAILEEGAEYNPVSYTPEVLQFLESRKFSVIEIARFLGLPPTKLFDGQAMTYNNIEHANLEVATDTLDAWTRNYEIEINTKLLKKGLKAEFDLFQVFRADTNTRANYYKTMLQLAAITSNEIRMSEGMAPYVGGDRYYMATNNFTPLDRLDDVIDSQTKDPEPTYPPKEDDSKEKEEGETEKELNRTLVKFFDAKLGK